MTVQLDIEDDVIGRDPAQTHKTAGIAADRLRSLIERIERLEEEKKALASDVKDIFTEASSAGFDVKVMRQLIRERKMQASEAQEQLSLLDLYRDALGMPR